jgi:hypothetical protein
LYRWNSMIKTALLLVVFWGSKGVKPDAKGQGVYGNH